MSRIQLAGVFLFAGLFWVFATISFQRLDVVSTMENIELFATRTSTVTETPTPTETGTPTPTSTSTQTPTPTNSPTVTATSTPRPTSTPTPIPTPPPYSYLGFTVSSWSRVPAPLTPGDRLEGHFQDLKGNTVVFYIEDPFGNRVHDPGTVFGRYSFSIIANTTGVYQMVFGDPGIFTNRTIGLYYRVRR